MPLARALALQDTGEGKSSSKATKLPLVYVCVSGVDADSLGARSGLVPPPHPLPQHRTMNTLPRGRTVAGTALLRAVLGSSSARSGSSA